MHNPQDIFRHRVRTGLYESYDILVPFVRVGKQMKDTNEFPGQCHGDSRLGWQRSSNTDHCGLEPASLIPFRYLNADL